MSKNSHLARHRAESARSNPLTAISQAVASNAGSVGRRAAIVTAASAAATGMLLGAGVPANAATATNVSVEVPASHAALVTTAASGALTIDRASVSSVAMNGAVAHKTRASTHTVRSGDTLSGIAVKHDVSLQSIFNLNNLGMQSIIYPGDIIRLNSSAPAGQAPAAVPAPAAAPAQAQAPAPAPAQAQAPAPAPAQAQAPAQQQVAAPAPAQGGTQALASNITPISSGNSSIAGYAKSMVGSPYVYGGTSATAGWDCSGFVQAAYAQAGIKLPRVNQWNALTQTSSPKAGDLVVQNGGSHVGIYLGNGKMVSALNPTQGTIVHSVSAMSVDGFYTN